MTLPPTLQPVPGRSPPSRSQTRRTAIIRTAIGLSALLHGAIAAAFLIVAHTRPHPPEARPTGEVELMMVEQKGSRTTAPTPSHAPAPAQQASRATAKAAKPAEQKEQTQPAPPPVAPAGEAAAPEPAKSAPTTASKAAATANAAPHPAETATPPAASPGPPVFDLAGTESDTNAQAFGDKILPASPDSRFVNHAPVYPHEAEMMGEHGTVIVLIHVADNGLPAGADVLQTSGVASLDEAALTAVRSWHFRPAIQAGKPVPFDMPFRFVFEDR